MTLLRVFRRGKLPRVPEGRQNSGTQLSQLHPLYLPEVLRIIFSYLTQHTLKTNVRFVCKQWFAASRPIIHLQALWKDRISNNYNHRFLLTRLDQVTHLRVLFEQLWVLNNTEFAWQELLETVDSLRLSGRLRITTLILNRVNFLESRIYTLLPKLSTLTEIRIEKMVQPTLCLGVILALCPNLREFSINHLDNFHHIEDNTDPCWPGTTHDMTRSKESGIRSIIIKRMSVEQSTLERILARCPQLNVLKLIGLCGTNFQTEPFNRPKFFTTIAKTCPQLECFHLSFQDIRMTQQDALMLNRTFYWDVQSMEQTQSHLQNQRLTTLSLYDNDLVDLPRSNPFEFSPYSNTLTSLEILTSSSQAPHHYVSHALHNFLCTIPTLVHLVAPEIPYFAEYLDLNGRADDEKEGFYYPRTCGRDRSTTHPHRIQRRMWACRGLRTLHLPFHSLGEDHPSVENGRIMFGYLARACPDLRDLAIQRKDLNMTLKGGMCLLTRMRHLERLTIVTDTSVRLERKDLEWLAKHPVKRSKLLLLPRFHRKSEVSRLQLSTIASTTTTTTTTTTSSLSLRDSSSGKSINMDDDSISNISAKTSEFELWTIEEMKDVGTVIELEKCRRELAERGCWPKLSFLCLHYAPIRNTHVTGFERYLPAMIRDVRPDIEFRRDARRWPLD
ncbi:hypothetical protein BGZ65_010353 [Modicella reniformis]|uniref:F-box domain-containing protein n=1 Tax=Modicella reniformis TaxID=1440133 RepID=A0A9P6IMF9_9FUNG|nr:hypothetical protein BGZ65_010353 [Modicella reniformis]